MKWGWGLGGRDKNQGQKSIILHVRENEKESLLKSPYASLKTTHYDKNLRMKDTGNPFLSFHSFEKTA